jgi:hypothetical protein
MTVAGIKGSVAIRGIYGGYRLSAIGFRLSTDGFALQTCLGRLHYPRKEDTPMKKVKRQSFGPYLDERERQMDDDYEWCLNDPEVRKAYGGKVVVAYKRKIWGVGKNHAAAWAAALRKRDCPSRGEVAIVVVPDYIPDSCSP